MYVTVRLCVNVHGRAKSRNFEGILSEGRMEDKIFFFLFSGLYILSSHEDLVLQRIKEEKANGLGI